MLGLLIIYYVGRGYYNLAETHNRSKWPYALLGLGIYFGSQFVVGICAYLIMEMNGNIDALDQNETALNLFGVLIAGLFTYIVYNRIKYKWESGPAKYSSPDLLDDEYL